MSILVVDEGTEGDSGTNENPTVVAQELGVNEAVLTHLKAMVYLLEVVADLEHGQTVKIFEGEE